VGDLTNQELLEGFVREGYVINGKKEITALKVQMLGLDHV
jgi:hypothetical protein